MKYILEFENWVSAVKEGFDAKIEDDKDTKDEIEIEAPNEDNTIIVTESIINKLSFTKSPQNIIGIAKQNTYDKQGFKGKPRGKACA